MLLQVACGGEQSLLIDASAGADSAAVDAVDAARSDADPEALLCSVAHGPVSPVATDDAQYSGWTGFACFLSKCLCGRAAEPFLSQLLTCDAVAGGFWWGLGSVHYRVMGRAGGACLIDVADESEGVIQYYRCEVPLPITPWEGLSLTAPNAMVGIESYCTATGSCSLQMDTCDASRAWCRSGATACSD